MAKKQRFAIVNIEYIDGKRAAEARAEEIGGQLFPVAKGDRCPGGADHAHMRYDGARYCSACDQYLSIDIDKSLGWFRR